MEINSINAILKIIKIFIRNYFIVFTANKLMSENSEKSLKQFLLMFVENIIITGCYIYIDDYYGIFYGTVWITLSAAIVLCINRKIDIGYSLILNIISICINYVILLISVALSGIIYKVVKLNDIINNIIIILVYVTILFKFINMKKFKSGLNFIEADIKNGYLDTVILNICAGTIFLITFIYECDINYTVRVLLSIFILSTIMFVTIFKSFQLYYKHRNLIKTLNLTEKELENCKEELRVLEKENLELNEQNHSLVHKQKALGYRIEKMQGSMLQENTFKETVDEYDEISKMMYKEKVKSPITKTEVKNIDEMLEYMQSECEKSKIEFNVQIVGNIFQMVNNYISKEDLEILIADHVKDAIIAIKHSENDYRSILVRIGKIEDIYSLYIFDSGVEFKNEILKNLGKKPCTTYSDEGGTGMGFMNTFKTLRKYNASLIINEIGEPSIQNYTKLVCIKFDGKNEFKIITYKDKINL